MKRLLLTVLLSYTTTAFANITIQGMITDRNGQPVQSCDVYFNKEMWTGDHSVHVNCDKNGHYKAEIEAGHYNSIYVCDGEKYAKTALEFWGWNLDLHESQTINAAFDTIEVFSLSSWASNGGSNSIFASFRPMRLKTPSYKTAQLNGKPIAVRDITPSLEADSIRGFIDGQPLELRSYSWSYEKLNSCKNFPDDLNKENGCYMPMVIAQFEKPKMAQGLHMLRVRLSDAKTGNIGEGITSFTSDASGFGF